MSTDNVRANYSELGARLIERMYSDDYLSIGGTESTDTLAALASLDASKSVLDIGSGLGGPALHLARVVGCSVTGVDLVETNVAEAERRAKAAGLANVRFETADALALPFDDASFDVVWGQDAWCHIPDKPGLISQVARVVKPGGTVVFTDWVEAGPMDDDYRAAVVKASASNNLATLDDYPNWLRGEGFDIARADDITDVFAEQYDDIVANLRTLEAQISGELSPKAFAIMLGKNECILEAFQAHKLGGIRVVAHKR